MEKREWTIEDVKAIRAKVLKLSRKHRANLAALKMARAEEEAIEELVRKPNGMYAEILAKRYPTADDIEVWRANPRVRNPLAREAARVMPFRVRFEPE